MKCAEQSTMKCALLPADNRLQNLASMQLAQLFKGYSSQRVKKDALWKPLLRNFRMYVRTCLRFFVEINQIYDSHGHMSQKAQESFERYIKSSGAPQSVAQNKMHHYSLAIMIAPSSTSNLDRFFVGLP